MEKDRISPPSATTRLRQWLTQWFSTRTRDTAPRQAGLRLTTVELTVPADPDLLTPGMRVALVEDACWALAHDWWTERRPPKWHRRERAAWEAERQRLEAKRERVRALVDAEHRH